MAKNHHVVPHPKGWAVKSEGASRASSVHGSKKEAVAQGREVSRNQRTELFIHGLNGQIQGRDSHGGDPHPPKG